MAVLVSWQGSNLQAIIEASRQGKSTGKPSRSSKTRKEPMP